MANVLEIVKILLGLYCVLAAWCTAVYVVKAWKVDDLATAPKYYKVQLQRVYIETAGKCSAKLAASVVVLAVMIYVTGV